MHAASPPGAIWSCVSRAILVSLQPSGTIALLSLLVHMLLQAVCLFPEDALLFSLLACK